MAGEHRRWWSLHPPVSLPVVLGVKGAARRLRRCLAMRRATVASGGGSA